MDNGFLTGVIGIVGFFFILYLSISSLKSRRVANRLNKAMEKNLPKDLNTPEGKESLRKQFEKTLGGKLENEDFEGAITKMKNLFKK